MKMPAQINLSRRWRLPVTLAAEGAEIKALHPLTDGPWIFARATLDGSAARTVRERARRGVKHPTGPYPDQQNLFSSMT